MKNNNLFINDDEVLNFFFEYYLLNENNFLNFEETFLPTLPNPKLSRTKFNAFRNDLSKGVRKPEIVAKINRFETLNKSIILQDQTNKLIKLENNNFTLRQKVDDLQRIIENNEKSVELKFEHLEEDLSNYINELLELINNINNNIKEIENSLKSIKNILDAINNLVEKIKDIEKNLINLDKKITSFINEFNDFILNNINDLKNVISKNITDLQNIIIENLTGELNKLKSNLRQYIFNELTEQTTDISTAIGGILTLQLGEQTTAILTDVDAALLTQTGELNLRLNSVNENINESKTEVVKKLDNFIDNILKNKIVEGIKEWYKENNNDIFITLTRFICERIVGESYIKYDCSNTYMPTLIFKFKTKNSYDERKYSQLKLRLNYKTSEITDIFIDKLTQELKKISNITYVSGNLRCVYVGEKRMFKTTVFSNSKETVINLLKNLMPFTNTSFIEKNISFTENSKREYNLKRMIPLKDAKVNVVNYNETILMSLSCVYLQVNGLNKQLEIF